MNKYSLLLVSLLLASCSVGPKIDVRSYEDSLTDQCIEKLPADKKSVKQDRANCVMGAMSKVRIMTGIFEMSEEKTMSDCRVVNASKEAADNCFLDKQKKFYDNFSENSKLIGNK